MLRVVVGTIFIIIFIYYLTGISFSAKSLWMLEEHINFMEHIKLMKKKFIYDLSKLLDNDNNTPHVFKGNCSGIIKINAGNQVNDIMCHGKNGEDYWYAAFNEIAKGDMQAATSGFTIIAAKGLFEELIGQKCMGAYIELEDQHYIWKGVCNIPDY